MRSEMSVPSTVLIPLLAGFALGAASGAIAQHKVDVETWIEMRKAGTGFRIEPGRSR